MPTVFYNDDFEWDGIKNKVNLKKHHISFATAIHIFNNIVFEMVSDKTKNEKRIVAIGQIDNVETVVIYTIRGRRKRIISARRAKHGERAIYRRFLEIVND